MAEDREDFERRAAEAIYQELLKPLPTDTHEAARAVLDAIGLTVDTAWSNEGRNLRQPYFDEPIDETWMRSAGWVKKRRLVSDWEEITDG